MSTHHHANTEIETELFPIVEPWPSHVNLAELLGETRRTIRRFVVCDEVVLDAVTLWVPFTWLIDWARTAPILVISAAEKGCGKTNLLTVIEQLCRRPLSTSNMSSPAIYRVIEAYGPTLLIDEADASASGDKELQSIINSGHTRGKGRVLRVASNGQDVQFFKTWGAKAMAGIGTFLHETTLDRSIRVELYRKRPDETVEELPDSTDTLIFAPLRRKFARFAEDNGEAIGNLRPKLPAGLNDRAQDNWKMLLAIADHAGGRWPEAARVSARQLSGKSHEALSLGAELLSDSRDIFDRTGLDKIGTHDYLARLNADEEKRWATYYRGKPLGPRQLAELLRGYGIQPRQLGGNGRNLRGYSRDQFENAFMRYLPAKAPESAVPSLPRTNTPPRDTARWTKYGLAKWAPSASSTLFPTATKDTSAIDKFPRACRGLSSPPAARPPLSASQKIMKNQTSSGIADKWGDDLDDIEL